MTKRINYIIAILFVIAGFVFKFALTGYTFLAFGMFSVAAIILFYTFLPMLKNKKAADILKKVATYALITFLIVLGVTECVLVNMSSNDNVTETDCIIVLGAGVRGTEPSPSLLWRLEAARDYLIEYPSACCIVSGCQGNNEDISEAECMYRWLTNNGISEKRVIMEDKAENTSENIRYSIEIGNEYGFTSYSVVTADYHICRAYLISVKNEIEPVMVSAKTKLPVLKINYYFREAFALWYYGVTNLI